MTRAAPSVNAAHVRLRPAACSNPARAGICGTSRLSFLGHAGIGAGARELQSASRGIARAPGVQSASDKNRTCARGLGGYVLVGAAPRPASSETPIRRASSLPTADTRRWRQCWRLALSAGNDRRPSRIFFQAGISCLSHAMSRRNGRRWIAPRRSPVRARLAPLEKPLETAAFLCGDRPVVRWLVLSGAHTARHDVCSHDGCVLRTPQATRALRASRTSV
jgi:hypothetical protein